MKIILDLCGGTGAWSKPYADRSDEYDVRVITQPIYDVTKFTPPGNVYGILAAPPCTEFSFARNGALIPRDLKSGLIAVHACQNIITRCILSGSLKFWALENPKGYLRKFLGKPPLTFNPFDFGDDYSKATDLWGFYNMPEKTPTDNKHGKFAVKSDYLPEVEFRDLFNPDGYIKDLVMDKRQVRRSVTPRGFASAFFKANK